MNPTKKVVLPDLNAGCSLSDSCPADKLEAHWRDALEFADPQLIVACDADVVVGVVGFDRCRDKGTPPTLGEIWTLQVALKMFQSSC